MKILHVGGYYPVTKALARFHISKEHEVKTACLSKPTNLFEVPAALSQMHDYIDQLADEEFDIIQFHRPECFLSVNRDSEALAIALRKLKYGGAKLIYYSYGCDSNTQNGAKSDQVSLPDDEILECFDHVVIGRSDQLEVAKEKFGTDEDKWSWMPPGVLIDIDRFSTPSVSDRDVKIIHIPNGAASVDTDFIVITMAMVEAMCDGFEFDVLDPREVADLTKLKSAVREADMVIEQVTQQTYGYLGALALSMGKIVLSGRQAEGEQEGCPVVEANMSNLQPVLMELLNDTDKLNEIIKDSIEFAKSSHDIEKIGESSLELYEKLLSDSTASKPEEIVFTEELDSALATEESSEEPPEEQQESEPAEQVEAEAEIQAQTETDTEQLASSEEKVEEKIEEEAIEEQDNQPVTQEEIEEVAELVAKEGEINNPEQPQNDDLSSSSRREVIMDGIDKAEKAVSKFLGKIIR